MRTVAALAAGCALWMAADAAPAAAQQGGVELRVRGGPSVPAGELGEVSAVGGTAGAGVAYQFHPNLEARIDVDAEWLDDRLDSRGVRVAPPVSMVHFHAGIGVDFPRIGWQHVPLTFGINVGGGGTVMSSDGMVVDPATGDESEFTFDETYFSLNGGAELGYELSPTVDVFASGQAYLTFVDTEDTAAFRERSPDVGRFGHAWSFPLTAGVRIAVQ